MAKQTRTTKSMRSAAARRPYRMRRRAELVDATRQRIIEAAVRLHTTVGPANASIAAIAEEAGVTRLTVYRHFADAEELFTACMAHHAALYPRPDPAAWATNPDLGDRARVALTGLYGWYVDHGADLVPLVRDIALLACGRRRAKPAASGGPRGLDRGRRERETTAPRGGRARGGPLDVALARGGAGPVDRRGRRARGGLGLAAGGSLSVADPARAPPRGPTSGGPGRSPGRGGRGRSTAASRGPRAGGVSGTSGKTSAIRSALGRVITVSSAATMQTSAPVDVRGQRPAGRPGRRPGSRRSPTGSTCGAWRRPSTRGTRRSRRAP